SGRNIDIKHERLLSCLLLHRFGWQRTKLLPGHDLMILNDAAANITAWQELIETAFFTLIPALRPAQQPLQRRLSASLCRPLAYAHIHMDVGIGADQRARFSLLQQAYLDQ